VARLRQLVPHPTSVTIDLAGVRTPRVCAAVPDSPLKLELGFDDVQISRPICDACLDRQDSLRRWRQIY
jgi:hypothetical protein